jgi:hypothetical protein
MWRWEPCSEWTVDPCPHSPEKCGLAFTEDCDAASHSGWLFSESVAADSHEWVPHKESLFRWRRRRWSRGVVASGVALQLLHVKGLTRVPHIRLSRPRHVVFAVHGIGVHSHAKMKKKLRGFRRTADTLQDEAYMVDVLGCEWDYVAWHLNEDEGESAEHDVLHSDGEDIPVEEDGKPPRDAVSPRAASAERDDASRQPSLTAVRRSLANITLASMPAVRRLVQSTLVDGAMYFSEEMSTAMIHAVVDVRAACPRVASGAM